MALKTPDHEDLTMKIFFGSETAMCFYEIERSRVISLGSGLNQDICCIDSAALSDAHILFRSTQSKDMINVKGNEGCYLNGRFIPAMMSADINYGDVIQAGDLTLLWLKNHIGIRRLSRRNPAIIRLPILHGMGDMYISPAKTTANEKSAPPRNIAVLDRSSVRLDAPPAKKEIRRQKAYTLIGPALTMAIPMSLGCGLYIRFSSASSQGSSMYMYTGLVTAVASALLGAMWAAVNVRNARLEEAMAEELRVKSYTAYIEECDRSIRDKYRYNQNAMKRNDPSLKDIFSSRAVSVFNRRRGDEDLFRYRIGTGCIPFDIKIEVPEEKFLMVPDELASLPLMLKKKYSMLNDVPVCVDAMKNRIIGFISDDPEELARLLYNMALQIGATTGPDIVRMVFLSFGLSLPEGLTDIFSFLPQVMGEDEHFVCPDKDRSRELMCSFETTVRGMDHMGLRWMIFTDDPREIPLSITRREDVSIFVFATRYDILPGDCSLVVQNDSSYRGILNIGERDGRCDVDFDRIGKEDAKKYVRCIASTKIRTEALRGVIPGRVTLPAVYETKEISASLIRSNWDNNDTRNSLMAPIGMGADGRKIYLDIHEKAHGPHGLVAGMTGSGKSELLSALILSLSVRYSPCEVGFLLIDYKGGGMANLFAGLPHLRGSISNLSGNMISRAMVSIRSEHLRRQKLFLKAGVNSITDYGRLYRSGRVTEPLPHLMIIIDEFAELKRNEPDFMKELISVAQVGRSLGVHLILATQKPAGTVDDNIFSNSRFRICLRVQDKQDSNDMLHKPDAAYIKEPGRAFLQVGSDEVYEEFKSAYVMEPCENEGRKATAYLVDRYGRRREITGPTDTFTGNEDMIDGRDTHFSVIMKDLKKCMDERGGYPLKDLWLEPLPDTVITENDTDYCSKYDVMIGLYDEPASQHQGRFILNLFDTGHLAVCGSSLSGKSTFLQTMVTGLIRKCTPDDINIYIVDHSSGILSCLRDSNVVGDYIGEEDEDKLKNLFYMLEETAAARRKDRDAEHTPILLLIDNYGRFREKTECSYDRQMTDLIKFGEAVRIYVAMTAGAIGSNDIPARLFENCKTGISLRMNDKYQYSECLRQVRLPILPDDVKGRGLAHIEGQILEFQTALSFPGDDRQRMEQIRKMIRELNEGYPYKHAPYVPYIPKEPTVADLEKCTQGHLHEGIPIGYEADSGKPLYIKDPARSCMVLAGRRGSGKSNAVRVYEYFCKKRGLPVYRVKDINEFMERAGERKDAVVILENAATAIEDFYKTLDRSAEEEFLNLISEEKGLRFIFTMSDTDHVRVAGFKAYERITSDCLGIYFGGSLDKQNIFDYSYLPFGELCMAREKGVGTILRRRGFDRGGDVVVPAA
ncbi:MAG: hypothetical protein K5857_08715 [Lachnospiraceae bacterium]|nr:hypothetical protein [Lachnospiraceae bacterium]